MSLTRRLKILRPSFVWYLQESPILSRTQSPEQNKGCLMILLEKKNEKEGRLVNTGQDSVMSYTELSGLLRGTGLFKQNVF